jgi:hypothetical protein
MRRTEVKETKMAGTAAGVGAGNLYIVDSEYQGMGEALERHRDALIEMIAEYLKVTGWLCVAGEGQHIDALRRYREHLMELPTAIAEAGAHFKQDCEQFVLEIDQADELLY